MRDEEVRLHSSPGGAEQVDTGSELLWASGTLHCA